MTPATESALGPLRAAGLPEHDAREWSESFPATTGDFDADARELRAPSGAGPPRSFARLPPKPRRNEAEQAAADALIVRRARLSRIVSRRPCRGGLRSPDRARLDLPPPRRPRLRRGEPRSRDWSRHERRSSAEAAHPQRDKDGVEIDQGLFLAHVLSRPRIGEHLCHAMLLPRPESAALARRIRRARLARSWRGAPDATRQGRSSRHGQSALPQRRGRHDARCRPRSPSMSRRSTERPRSPSCAASSVENEKYRGRRIFGAGINLTHLYLGKIPFLWFLIRDLGYVHKLLRGVATPDSVPDDVNGRGVEKLWIAAVDTFAIGGHCQALLCMDYVLAASDAFLTLAGAQGRNHPRLRQFAPAALRRRPHRATSHPLRAQTEMRQRRRGA